MKIIKTECPHCAAHTNITSGSNSCQYCGSFFSISNIGEANNPLSIITILWLNHNQISSKYLSRRPASTYTFNENTLLYE